MRAFILLLVVVGLAYSAWQLTTERVGSGHSTLLPEARLPVNSEMGDARSLISQLPASVSQIESVAVVARSCYSLGPFDSSREADEVARLLKQQSVPYRLRVGKERQPKEYRVYLAPAANRTEALELSRKLAEQGIEDFYIVSTVEERNAISLGIFDTEHDALQRVAQLQQLGYHPKTEVHYQEQGAYRYWLDTDTHSLRSLGGIAIQPLSPTRVQISSHDCG